MRQECRLLFVPSKFPSWSMTPSGFCQKYIFSFFSKIFHFLVLSSKYTDLKLDMFTRFRALGYIHFVAPSGHWTFLLEPKRDMPSRLCFFNVITLLSLWWFESLQNLQDTNLFCVKNCNNVKFGSFLLVHFFKFFVLNVSSFHYKFCLLISAITSITSTTSIL